MVPSGPLMAKGRPGEGNLVARKITVCLRWARLLDRIGAWSGLAGLGRLVGLGRTEGLGWEPGENCMVGCMRPTER